MPGPPPKRTSQRRRRNQPDRPTDHVVPAGPVEQPEPADTWHPIAVDWYRSLAESGQAVFFEPSDWQAARYLAEVITENFNAGKFSAVLFGQVWSAMGDLLTTEGSRRRARVEIERGVQVDPDEERAVTALDDYVRRLSG